MARDAKGSRWLQEALPRFSVAQQEEVAAELKPELLELASHPFGNYLVSRLAHLPSLQPHLLDQLRGHVLPLMRHAQGSRVLQATLKALPAAAAAALVAELEGSVGLAAADVHGSWSVAAAYERTRAPFILREISADLPLPTTPCSSRSSTRTTARSARRCTRRCC